MLCKYQSERRDSFLGNGFLGGQYAKSLYRRNKKISRRQLFKFHYDAYTLAGSKAIALTLQRYIKETPKLYKTSKVYVEDIRKKIFFIHEYNGQVAQVSINGRYPKTMAFIETLVRYLELEQEIIEKIGPDNSEYEKRRRHLMERLLKSIFYDIISYNVANLSTQEKSMLVSKQILETLILVRPEYKKSNTAIDKIATDLLKPLGCATLFDEQIRGKNLPLERSEFLTENVNNSLSVIANLSTLDYDSDKEDLKCEDFINTKSKICTDIRRVVDEDSEVKYAWLIPNNDMPLTPIQLRPTKVSTVVLMDDDRSSKKEVMYMVCNSKEVQSRTRTRAFNHKPIKLEQVEHVISLLSSDDEDDGPATSVRATTGWNDDDVKVELEESSQSTETNNTSENRQMENEPNNRVTQLAVLEPQPNSTTVDKAVLPIVLPIEDTKVEEVTVELSPIFEKTQNDHNCYEPTDKLTENLESKTGNQNQQQIEATKVPIDNSAKDKVEKSAEVLIEEILSQTEQSADSSATKDSETRNLCEESAVVLIEENPEFSITGNQNQQQIEATIVPIDNSAKEVEESAKVLTEEILAQTEPSADSSSTKDSETQNLCEEDAPKNRVQENLSSDDQKAPEQISANSSELKTISKSIHENLQYDDMENYNAVEKTTVRKTRSRKLAAIVDNQSDDNAGTVTDNDKTVLEESFTGLVKQTRRHKDITVAAKPAEIVKSAIEKQSEKCTTRNSARQTRSRKTTVKTIEDSKLAENHRHVEQKPTNEFCDGLADVAEIGKNSPVDTIGSVKQNKTKKQAKKQEELWQSVKLLCPLELVCVLTKNIFEPTKKPKENQKLTIATSTLVEDSVNTKKISKPTKLAKRQKKKKTLVSAAPTEKSTTLEDSLAKTESKKKLKQITRLENLLFCDLPESTEVLEEWRSELEEQSTDVCNDWLNTWRLYNDSTVLDNSVTVEKNRGTVEETRVEHNSVEKSPHLSKLEDNKLVKNVSSRKFLDNYQLWKPSESTKNAVSSKKSRRQRRYSTSSNDSEIISSAKAQSLKFIMDDWADDEDEVADENELKNNVVEQSADDLADELSEIIAEVDQNKDENHDHHSINSDETTIFDNTQPEELVIGQNNELDENYDHDQNDDHNDDNIVESLDDTMLMQKNDVTESEELVIDETANEEALDLTVVSNMTVVSQVVDEETATAVAEEVSQKEVEIEQIVTEVAHEQVVSEVEVGEEEIVMEVANEQFMSEVARNVSEIPKVLKEPNVSEVSHEQHEIVSEVVKEETVAQVTKQPIVCEVSTLENVSEVAREVTAATVAVAQEENVTQVIQEEIVEAEVPEEKVASEIEIGNEEVVSEFTKEQIVFEVAKEKIVSEIAKEQIVCKVAGNEQTVANIASKVTKELTVSKDSILESMSEVAKPDTVCEVQNEAMVSAVTNEKIVAQVTIEQSVSNFSIDKIVSEVTREQTVAKVTFVAEDFNDHIVSEGFNDHIVSEVANSQTVSKFKKEPIVSEVDFGKDEIVSEIDVQNDEVVSEVAKEQTVLEDRNEEIVSPVTNDQIASKVANEQSVSKITNDEIVSEVTNDQILPTEICAFDPCSTPNKVNNVSNSDLVEENSTLFQFANLALVHGTSERPQEVEKPVGPKMAINSFKNVLLENTSEDSNDSEGPLLIDEGVNVYEEDTTEEPIVFVNSNNEKAVLISISEPETAFDDHILKQLESFEQGESDSDDVPLAVIKGRIHGKSPKKLATMGDKTKRATKNAKTEKLKKKPRMSIGGKRTKSVNNKKTDQSDRTLNDSPVMPIATKLLSTVTLSETLTTSIVKNVVDCDTLAANVEEQESVLTTENNGNRPKKLAITEKLMATMGSKTKTAKKQTTVKPRMTVGGRQKASKSKEKRLSDRDTDKIDLNDNSPLLDTSVLTSVELSPVKKPSVCDTLAVKLADKPVLSVLTTPAPLFDIPLTMTGRSLSASAVDSIEHKIKTKAALKAYEKLYVKLENMDFDNLQKSRNGRSRSVDLGIVAKPRTLDRRSSVTIDPNLTATFLTELQTAQTESEVRCTRKNNKNGEETSPKSDLNSLVNKLKKKLEVDSQLNINEEELTVGKRKRQPAKPEVEQLEKKVTGSKKRKQLLAKKVQPEPAPTKLIEPTENVKKLVDKEENVKREGRSKRSNTNYKLAEDTPKVTRVTRSSSQKHDHEKNNPQKNDPQKNDLQKNEQQKNDNNKTEHQFLLEEYEADKVKSSTVKSRKSVKSRSKSVDDSKQTMKVDVKSSLRLSVDAVSTPPKSGMIYMSKKHIIMMNLNKEQEKLRLDEEKKKKRSAVDEELEGVEKKRKLEPPPMEKETKGVIEEKQTTEENKETDEKSKIEKKNTEEIAKTEIENNIVQKLGIDKLEIEKNLEKELLYKTEKALENTEESVDIEENMKKNEILDKDAIDKKLEIKKKLDKDNEELVTTGKKHSIEENFEDKKTIDIEKKLDFENLEKEKTLKTEKKHGIKKYLNKDNEVALITEKEVEIEETPEKEKMPGTEKKRGIDKKLKIDKNLDKPQKKCENEKNLDNENEENINTEKDKDKKLEIEKNLNTDKQYKSEKKHEKEEKLETQDIVEKLELEKNPPNDHTRIVHKRKQVLKNNLLIEMEEKMPENEVEKTVDDKITDKKKNRRKQPNKDEKNVPEVKGKEIMAAEQIMENQRKISDESEIKDQQVSKEYKAEGQIDKQVNETKTNMSEKKIVDEEISELLPDQKKLENETNKDKVEAKIIIDEEIKKDEIEEESKIENQDFPVSWDEKASEHNNFDKDPEINVQKMIDDKTNLGKESGIRKQKKTKRRILGNSTLLLGDQIIKEQVKIDEDCEIRNQSKVSEQINCDEELEIKDNSKIEIRRKTEDSPIEGLEKFEDQDLTIKQDRMEDQDTKETDKVENEEKIDALIADDHLAVAKQIESKRKAKNKKKIDQTCTFDDQDKNEAEKLVEQPKIVDLEQVEVNNGTKKKIGHKRKIEDPYNFENEEEMLKNDVGIIGKKARVDNSEVQEKVDNQENATEKLVMKPREDEKTNKNKDKSVDQHKNVIVDRKEQLDLNVLKKKLKSKISQFPVEEEPIEDKVADNSIHILVNEENPKLNMILNWPLLEDHGAEQVVESGVCCEEIVTEPIVHLGEENEVGDQVLVEVEHLPDNSVVVGQANELESDNELGCASVQMCESIMDDIVQIVQEKCKVSKPVSEENSSQEFASDLYYVDQLFKDSAKVESAAPVNIIEEIVGDSDNIQVEEEEEAEIVLEQQPVTAEVLDDSATIQTPSKINIISNVLLNKCPEENSPSNQTENSPAPPTNVDYFPETPVIEVETTTLEDINATSKLSAPTDFWHVSETVNSPDLSDLITFPSTSTGDSILSCASPADTMKLFSSLAKSQADFKQCVSPRAVQKIVPDEKNIIFTYSQHSSGSDNSQTTSVLSLPSIDNAFTESILQNDFSGDTGDHSYISTGDPLLAGGMGDNEEFQFGEFPVFDNQASTEPAPYQISDISLEDLIESTLTPESNIPNKDSIDPNCLDNGIDGGDSSRESGPDYKINKVNLMNGLWPTETNKEANLLNGIEEGQDFATSDDVPEPANNVNPMTDPGLINDSLSGTKSPINDQDSRKDLKDLMIQHQNKKVVVMLEAQPLISPGYHLSQNDLKSLNNPSRTEKVDEKPKSPVKPGSIWPRTDLLAPRKTDKLQDKSDKILNGPLKKTLLDTKDSRPKVDKKPEPPTKKEIVHTIDNILKKDDKVKENGKRRLDDYTSESFEKRRRSNYDSKYEQPKRWSKEENDAIFDKLKQGPVQNVRYARPEDKVFTTTDNRGRPEEKPRQDRRYSYPHYYDGTPSGSQSERKWAQEDRRRREYPRSSTKPSSSYGRHSQHGYTPRSQPYPPSVVPPPGYKPHSRTSAEHNGRSRVPPRHPSSSRPRTPPHDWNGYSESEASIPNFSRPASSNQGRFTEFINRLKQYVGDPKVPEKRQKNDNSYNTGPKMFYTPSSDEKT